MTGYSLHKSIVWETLMTSNEELDDNDIFEQITAMLGNPNHTDLDELTELVEVFYEKIVEDTIYLPEEKHGQFIIGEPADDNSSTCHLMHLCARVNASREKMEAVIDVERDFFESHSVVRIVNTLDSHGISPIKMAMGYANYEAFKALQSLGADLNLLFDENIKLVHLHPDLKGNEDKQQEYKIILTAVKNMMRGEKPAYVDLGTMRRESLSIDEPYKN